MGFVLSDEITEQQRAAARLLERNSPGPERLAELRGLLREMIRGYRGAHPRATYREALASVHAPLGADATLYAQALAPDPSDDEDDEDLAAPETV